LIDLKLNIDEIRQFESCKKLTDEQAEQVAEMMAMFAIITFNTMKNETNDR